MRLRSKNSRRGQRSAFSRPSTAFIGACFTILLCAPSSAVNAQAQGGDDRKTLTFQGKKADPFSLRDYANRPCITVLAQVIPVTNTKIYEHHILAENTCALPIVIDACYAGSTSCVRLRVPPHDLADAVLGYMPGDPSFEFTWREAYAKK